MDSPHSPQPAAILPQLTHWYRDHHDQLTATGVTSALRESPPEWPKASVSLSMDSGTRLSQLTVWESGETELDLADIDSGIHTPAAPDHHHAGRAR